jgi:ABC-2 type transport system permease protein
MTSCANPIEYGSASATGAFIAHSLAILAVEFRKMVRDPTDLFTRAVQPLLWLLVFGQVFARTRAIPTGSLTYVEFMAPGVLARCGP